MQKIQKNPIVGNMRTYSCFRKLEIRENYFLWSIKIFHQVNDTGKKVELLWTCYSFKSINLSFDDYNSFYYSVDRRSTRNNNTTHKIIIHNNVQCKLEYLKTSSKLLYDYCDGTTLTTRTSFIAGSWNNLFAITCTSHSEIILQHQNSKLKSSLC